MNPVRLADAADAGDFPAVDGFVDGLTIETKEVRKLVDGEDFPRRGRRLNAVGRWWRIRRDWLSVARFDRVAPIRYSRAGLDGVLRAVTSFGRSKGWPAIVGGSAASVTDLGRTGVSVCSCSGELVPEGRRAFMATSLRGVALVLVLADQPRGVRVPVPHRARVEPDGNAACDGNRCPPTALAGAQPGGR